MGKWTVIIKAVSIYPNLFSIKNTARKIIDA